jgi:hypothetical protein
LSDSLPTKLIIDYERRIISKDDVKEGLKKPNSMKQLSLHLQELCDIIIPSKAYLFNAYDKIRKELDINEYGSN